MGILNTRIVPLLSLLYFAYGSVGNALIRKATVGPDGIVAHIHNVQVSYVTHFTNGDKLFIACMKDIFASPIH